MLGQAGEAIEEQLRGFARFIRLNRPIWVVFPGIAIIGTITWLAIFEQNYHPRTYRYSEDVTILQEGVSWTSSVQRER